MQIWPRDADVRKVLRHANGVGFNDEGPAEWPDDTFTHKQIRDGSVSKEDPGASAQADDPKKAKEGKAEAKAEGKAEAKKE
jgi:hypothetical protein